MCKGTEACAAEETSQGKRWSEMEDEFEEELRQCGGSQEGAVAIPSTSPPWLPMETELVPSWQPATAMDLQDATGQWRPPLPVRALKSRLRGHASRPTWSAWLPRSLQQQTFSGDLQNSEASGDALPCQDASHMMACSSDCSGQQFAGAETSMWVADDGMVYQTVYVPVQEWTSQEWSSPSDPSTFFDASQDPSTFFDSSQVEQPCLTYDDSLSLPAPQDNRSTGPLAGRVWKLSQDEQGCRRVQQAFEEADDHERERLAAELKGHVWQALKCGHANHVLQKAITTIRPESIQFIINELTHNGTGGAAAAARHRFGCRIIERLLENCAEEQLSVMVEELIADTVLLSDHVYGYYVIQHLLEHCGPDVVTRISSTLEENLPILALNGYSGSVIGKALSQSSNAVSKNLAEALLKDAERLCTTACSRWGHAAVEEALQQADPQKVAKACSDLQWYSGKLRTSRYGRHVASFIADRLNTSFTWNTNKAMTASKASPQKVSAKTATSAPKQRCASSLSSANSACFNLPPQHFAVPLVACN